MKQSKVILNLTDETKDVYDKSEPIEIQLARLAATASAFVEPNTQWEETFFLQEGEPYPGLDPVAAYADFKEMLAKYVATRVNINSAFEQLRKESAIQIGLGVIHTLSPSRQIPVRGGVIDGTLTPDFCLARDIANVVTIHTRTTLKKNEKKNEEVIIVHETSPADCAKAFLYNVSARTVRTALTLQGASNIVTRDNIYNYFAAQLSSIGIAKSSAQATLYRFMHDLSNQLLDYRVLQPESNVTHYNKYKSSKQKEKNALYQFDMDKFKRVDCEDIERVWRSFFEVMAATGGSRSSLFAGYSIIDTTASEADRLEEAMDIVNYCYRFGYEAVFLEDSSVALAKILVSSGLYVYSIILSNKDEPATNISPGLYRSGKRRFMYWAGRKAVNPIRRTTGIDYPPDVTPMESQRDYFAYDVLRASPPEGYRYLPSMHSAFGLCIKTNSEKEPSITVEYKHLVTRFSNAIACRSQYIYLRIPFYLIDSAACFFKKNITLPKIETKETKKGEYLTLDNATLLATDALKELRSFVNSISLGGQVRPPTSLQVLNSSKPGIVPPVPFFKFETMTAKMKTAYQALQVEKVDEEFLTDVVADFISLLIGDEEFKLDAVTAQVKIIEPKAVAHMLFNIYLEKTDIVTYDSETGKYLILENDYVPPCVLFQVPLDMWKVKPEEVEEKLKEDYEQVEEGTLTLNDGVSINE